MNRRAAIALATLASLAILLALAATSRASHPHRADAPDPLATAPLRPPSSTARTRDLCISGPGAAASALSSTLSAIPSTPPPGRAKSRRAPAAASSELALPALARRAFAVERLAERSSTSPAFPQRMGLAVTTPPPPTCVPTP